MDEYPIYFQSLANKGKISVGSIFLPDSDPSLAEVRDDIGDAELPLPDFDFVFLSRLGLPITTKQEGRISISYVLAENDWRIYLVSRDFAKRMTEAELEEREGEDMEYTHILPTDQNCDGDYNRDEVGFTPIDENIQRFDSLDDITLDSSDDDERQTSCFRKLVDLMFFVVFLMLLFVVLLGTLYYSTEYLASNGVKLPHWLNEWRLSTTKILKYLVKTVQSL